MLLDTSSLSSIPSLIDCTLNQSAEDASTLTLTFEGFLPLVGSEENAWLEYLAPVTLIRSGSPIFHGKVTAYSFSNDAGSKKTTITATDFIWLLDKSSLGSQVRSLQVHDVSSVALSATEALHSWEEIAPNLRLVAPGWACNAKGLPLNNATIEADISRAGNAVAGALTEEVWISAWEGLLKMKSANPNSLSHARPDGKLEILSISQAEELSLPVTSLLSVSGLSPRHEDLIDGVAAVIRYDTDDTPPSRPNNPSSPDPDQQELEKQLPGHWEERSYVITEPPGLDLTTCNIKIFDAWCPYKSQVLTQANHIWSQIKAYYEARSIIQWSGDISLLETNLSQSPLARRLSITGDDDAHPEWSSMQAIVTAVQWNFSTGEVSITLGKSYSDPEIHAIPYEYEQQEYYSSSSSSEDTTTENHNTHQYTCLNPGPGGNTQPGGGGGGSVSQSKEKSTSSETTPDTYSYGGCYCDYKWNQLLPHYNNKTIKELNSLRTKNAKIDTQIAYLDSMINTLWDKVSFFLCNLDLPDKPEPQDPQELDPIEPLVLEQPDE